MNLYISGSNRDGNSYKLAKELSSKEDKVIAFKDINIKYCLACNACAERIKDYCVQKDDMIEIYDEILKADKIIIVAPIYFDQISGQLKSFIDRWRPFGKHDLLRGKKVYLITAGSLTEEENEPVSKKIDEYFKSLSDIFEFEFAYLRNFTSDKNDNIEDNYDDYEKIIEEIKERLKV